MPEETESPPTAEEIAAARREAKAKRPFGVVERVIWLIAAAVVMSFLTLWGLAQLWVWED